MKKLSLLLFFWSAFAQAETLKIGIEGDYPPFSAINAKGELEGFDVDIAKALCAEMKKDCEMVQVVWDGLIPSLNAKKIDAIIASMNATDERKEQIDFSNKYYASGSKFVMLKEPASALTADNWRELLKGKIIGVQRGTSHDRYINETAKEIFKEVVVYGNQEEINLDLIAGRLDVTLADQTVMAGGFLKNNPNYAFGAPLIDEPLYYGAGVSVGLRKGDESLKNEFNSAIEAIRKSGKYQEISNQYFGFDIY